MTNLFPESKILFLISYSISLQLAKKHKNNQIYKDAKRDYYYVEKMTTIIRFTKCHLVRILGI